MPVEQDELFEEQAGTGRMQQNFSSFFRNRSTGHNMCAIFGKN